jgi:crotonobetainyl-CoA:carnitine CoA-transferase CaiB-like acyl-CoA transferase
MEAWGLGYEETLKPRLPRLIHCRISGFGADGPLGGLPGYDAVIQAMAGMMSVNGTAESGPTRLGIPLVDLGTGLYAMIAILMALVERARSGQGQYIDMTLFDSGLALMHPHIANHMLSGKVPRPTGNAHPNISPYDKFRTGKGEMFLAVGNDRAFRRLCTALGRPELAEDARFLHNAERLTNRHKLAAILEELLAGEDASELCPRLMALGVPAGPVWDTAEVLAHDHTRHRAMVVEQGWYKAAGTPVKLSRTPGGLRHPPPRFGEHGRAILAEHGFTDAEIAGLVERGVVVEQRRR